MKIALKYGLLVTAGVIAWVVVAHWLEPNPAARIHSIGAGIFFNVLEITAIALGIKARQREAGILSFKSGVKTGMSIAFVYGASAALFFLLQLLIVGPQILGVHSPDEPTMRVALQAFAGLFFGAVLMGLVYSTIISFIVVGKQRGRRYD